jgi:hypothetical protein
MKAKAAASGGPAVLGLHVIIGPAAPERLGNMIALIERGTIAPVQIICRRT